MEKVSQTETEVVGLPRALGGRETNPRVGMAGPGPGRERRSRGVGTKAPNCLKGGK